MDTNKGWKYSIKLMQQYLTKNNIDIALNFYLVAVSIVLEAYSNTFIFSIILKIWIWPIIINFIIDFLMNINNKMMIPFKLDIIDN